MKNTTQHSTPEEVQKLRAALDAAIAAYNDSVDQNVHILKRSALYTAECAARRAYHDAEYRLPKNEVGPQFYQTLVCKVRWNRDAELRARPRFVTNPETGHIECFEPDITR